MSRNPVTGRFAPSPTGPLHLGSLVAALGSWLLARKSGGRWLLRIDDLDLQRVIPGMADDIMRTLETLGLEWDEEPLWQSRRSHAYQEALDRLVSLGVTYPCSCSRAEVARIASAPHGGGDEMAYPGKCRAGTEPGREPRSVRIRVPESDLAFRDGVSGYQKQYLSETCGDFIIKRGDGLFAYHLATVVDDGFSGITQVVRGADLLFSTPRQIYLQQLLDLATPAYIHLPLVTGADGAKLSKRDNPVSLAQRSDLRRDGGRLLLAALHFLGQPDLGITANAPVREILGLATERFTLGLVPVIGGPFPVSRLA